VESANFTYEGRNVVVGTDAGEDTVVIDGESIPVEHVAESDQYIATLHSPHTSHASLDALAKHVIDHVLNARDR
jgi:hypothetical protein